MGDNQQILSIIIPVYNVEKYIKQCVNSVLEQHLQNYEIILVDDGSPDNCPYICDEYAKLHPEILVIHQENSGLSEARNAGIRASNGKYVAFIDSDDWWNPNVSVKEILNAIEDDPHTEMFLFTSLDYIDGDGYYKRSEHKHLERIRTMTVQNYYQDLLANGNLEVSACTKFLKRDFLIKHNLFFSSGLLGEDNQWMIRVLRCLSSVRIINQPLYICRISRDGSITHSIKKKNVEDLLIIIEESIEYCRDEKSRKEISELELCFCSYLWFSALGLSQKISRKDQESLLPRFKSTSVVCQYSNSPKTRLAYNVQRILGIRITAIILGEYIRLRGRTRLNRDKVNI